MAKRNQAQAPKTPAPRPAPAPNPRLQGLENWLQKHRLWVCLLILLVSLGLRAVYFQQAKSTPLMAMHRWEASDMEFFDSWAKHLAAGDWRCDTVLHPFHSWHKEFAQQYFNLYPETATRYYSAFPADTLAAQKALVNDYYNGKAYHQEPLYAYLVALTYHFFGEDQWRVYLWQFLLGALVNVLVFLIGLRSFGALPGLLGAMLVMISGPMLVSDMVLLRTTLTVFLSLLLLHLYQRALEKPDWKRHAVFGAATGAALLAQSYLVLFVLLAWVWASWLYRKQWALLGKNFAAFGIAVLLVLSPVFIRNIQVGIPAGTLASNGAMTYIPANCKISGPLESFYVHTESLVKLMHESDGKMGAAVLACLGTFENASDMWDIYRQKLEGLFMNYELANNFNYYAYKEYAPILKQLPTPYFLVAPMALAGVFLGLWRQRQRSLPVLLMLLTSVAPAFIGSSLARYRAPFVVIASLVAGYFLVALLRDILEKRWKSALAGLVLFSLAFAYTSKTPARKMFPYFNQDIYAPYAVYFMPQLIELEKAKDFESYAKLTSELLSYVPRHFFEKKISDPVRISHEAQCCKTVARFLDMHVGALEKSGKTQEAAPFKERASILRSRAEGFDERVRQR